MMNERNEAKFQSMMANYFQCSEAVRREVVKDWQRELDLYRHLLQAVD